MRHQFSSTLIISIPTFITVLCLTEEERGNITVQHNLFDCPNLVAVGKYNQIPLMSQAEGTQEFLHMVHAHYF